MSIKEVRNRKGLLFSENGEVIGLKQIYVAFGVVVVIDENCIVKAKQLTSETTNYLNLGQFDEDADWSEVVNSVKNTFIGNLRHLYRFDDFVINYDIVFGIEDYIDYLVIDEDILDRKECSKVIYNLFETKALRINNLLSNTRFIQYLIDINEINAIRERSVINENNDWTSAER